MITLETMLIAGLLGYLLGSFEKGIFFFIAIPLVCHILSYNKYMLAIICVGFSALWAIYFHQICTGNGELWRWLWTGLIFVIALIAHIGKYAPELTE